MQSPDNRPPMKGKDYLAMAVCYAMVGLLFWAFSDHIELILYSMGWLK